MRARSTSTDEPRRAVTMSDVVLRRYWITFSSTTSLPSGALRGCGVTAYDRADALTFVRELVFEGVEPPVADIIEDIDVSTLDAGHVLPSMLPPSNRGIWFPLGFSTLGTVKSRS